MATEFTNSTCLNRFDNISYLNVSCELILGYSVPLYGYCTPFLLFTTVTANTMIVLVLKKRNMTSPTNLVLMAMALCDMFTLLFPAPGLLYMYTFGNHYKPLGPVAACYIWNALNEIFPAMFHTASIWLTLALAVQRSFTPINIEWSDNIPTYDNGGSMYQNETVCHIDTADWIDQYIGIDLYFSFYFLFRIIFVHMIPCTCLVTLNVLLFKAMKQAQRKREELFRQNRKKESKKLRDANCTTLMLIVVVTVFLTAEIPLAIITALHIISSAIIEFLDYRLANLCILFANFFLIVSYPINFAIYCGMSRQFRETFKDIFIRRAVSVSKTESSSRYSLVNATRTCTNETAL